jgi:serine O-acetyltransferase
MFNFILLRLYSEKYSFQISPNTKIGRGLYIGHYGRLIINPDAVLGDNINLSTGVVIGQQSRGERQGSPTLGSRVWIGANAVIVGRINIGDNVLIAPNSYVNFDVPSNSIVIGNPAKIISREDATVGYINNPV